MAKFKKNFGILFVVGLMLAIVISYASNLDPIKSEELEGDSSEFQSETEEESQVIIKNEVEPIPNASANVISVKDYGAKGDGITDDTKAIQKALNYASDNNVILVIPESSEAYLIQGSLKLNSNTHIVGYDAELFMPSQSAVSVMLFSKSSAYISNVTIKGLKLSSTNDRVGTGEYEGSMTSYVEGISIWGVSGLTIQDVQMENLYMGLKLERSGNGLYNEKINVNNINVYNTRNPLYMAKTTDFTMTNSILDGSGGGTKFLHAAYIRGDVNNSYFNNVTFQNTPGGGINMYNEISSPASNITFDNCTVDEARVGVYVYSNANNINFNNLKITNSGLGIKVFHASNLLFNGLTMTDFSNNKEESGGFRFTSLKNSQFNNVSINADTMTGSVWNLVSNVSKVTAINFNATNIGGVPFTNMSRAVKKMEAINLAISSNYLSGYNITGTEETTTEDTNE